MIDFRYHLVSIISIFLALAVGIVLGAGPLQSTIGAGLGDQVIALRSEKQTLNDQLTASEKLVEASGEYETAVQPRVVGGRLANHRVAVVVLPSADSAVVDSLEAVVPQSGATLTGTVTVGQDWFDPTQAADRSAAVAKAATALGVGGSSDAERAAEVLARIVASTTTSGTGTTTQRTDALAVLADAGLVDSSVDALPAADVVLVVSGDYAGTAAQVEATSVAVRSLVTALARNSAATLVAGGEPVAAAGQPASSDAVAAVRADSGASDLVATVDHVRAGNGPGTVVLAVEDVLDGRVGHYGTAKGATATVPRVLP